MHVARWEYRRQDSRTAQNADQTEFNALAHGRSNLDAGTFDERLAQALDVYEVNDPLKVEDWASLDLALDNATSSLGGEILRRKRIMKSSYPFDVEKNEIIYTGSESLAYELCLAVSESQSLTTGHYADLPVAFERLMKELVVLFLGEGAKGRRTGWPPGADRVNRFKEVIADLHDATQEWPWQPSPGHPDDPDPVQVKDEGLDFVAWKEVDDTRVGRLFVLGQCACGDNYTQKLQDLDANFTRLGKWIRPICYAKPIRAFCTPRHIPNDMDFGDLSLQAGIVFDRSRIAILAEQHSTSVVDAAVDDYESLIKLVIPTFQRIVV